MDDLRKHVSRKESLDHMTERIEALRYRRESIKSASNSEPVQGGATQMEDRLINSFCEEERLRYNILSTQILVEGLDRALESLNDVQRKVLDRFYINPVKDCVDCLHEELSYERSQIYRIKDAALYGLTIRLYGIVDS